jgi:Methylase involved in ubiquinone/menaquinone biosynthesis
MSDHAPSHAHRHGHDDGSLARLLDLDAVVHQSLLNEVMTWLQGVVSAEPVRRILDVGAGSGSGTEALARRFADAEVTALDVSEHMLDRVRSRGNAAGLSARVSTALADVSVGIGELGGFDLAWAAMSLHEIADPAQAFRNLHAALRPGGHLAVVETDQSPRVLPADLTGFEERINAVVDRSGPHAADHPDWTPFLQAAGLTLVEQRTFTTLGSAPGSGPAGEYARLNLQRMADAVLTQLDAEDQATLETLLGTGPDAVQHLTLSIRGARTAWLAQRPV